MLELSIVVPCFNEEASLRATHARILTSCKSQNIINFEIIYINDGSTDSTWQIITSYANGDPRIRGINLSRNFGHQMALTAGLMSCKGQQILIVDADLQDPPELLGKMRDEMKMGHDIVYGVRKKRSGESFFKKISANLFYRLLALMTDVPIPVDTGDFRLVSKRALDSFLSMPESHRFIRGMMAWIGYSQKPIYYDRDVRFAGQTHYSLKKMLQFALVAMTSRLLKNS